MAAGFRNEDGSALEIVLKQVDDKTFEVERAFLYEDRQGKEHRIPVGFLTDLASIPRALRFFGGRHGRHTPAAIVHDQGVHQGKGAVARTLADDLFFEMLLCLKVRPWRARTMWSAVHLQARWTAMGALGKVLSVLWFAMALGGYSGFLLSMLGVGFGCSGSRLSVCLAWQPSWWWALIFAAAPLSGALLWLTPQVSFKRWWCGVVAGYSLVVLGPFGALNMLIIAISWAIDRISDWVLGAPSQRSTEKG